MHPDGYFALVLSKESSARLVAAYATLPDRIAHHCTIVYGARDPEVLPHPLGPADLGALHRLKVRGFAESAGVQAVAVALILPDGRLLHEGFSRNRVPHVTIATDGETDASASNALLEAGFEEIDGPELEATLLHCDSR